VPASRSVIKTPFTMKKNFNRRDFVSGCIKAGSACVLLASGGNLFASGTLTDDKPDPRKLEYCGYKCPDDCPLKKGTLENNVELKKKAYTEFGMKKKYGIDFDPEKIFCYGCKSPGKPIGPSVKGCKVRECAIAKGLESCIQCNTLSKCEKDLWKEFPKLHEHVLSLQKKYQS
jgi:hypothetical protein